MKRKIFQLLIAGVIVVTGGCGKSKFLDINNDPNNPTDVPPKVLLPAAQIGAAFANGNELSRVASVLIQHNAGTANQALGFDVYNLDGNFDNAWNFEIYSNAVSDLRALIAKTETASPAYSGIAKILLAYTFSLATDLWGDVPYSQAGFGLDFPNPRFDKQEDIYQGNNTLGVTSLFDLVKAGLADLDKPSALLPTGVDDLIYAGNLANWKRAGNTLILKFAIQISGVNATLAKSQIDAVITGNNYITNNTQDWEVPFGTAVGSQSPLYSFNIVNRPTDQMLSNTFLNLMVSQNDQVRLGKLYTSPGGVFTGFDNGSTAVPPPAANRSKYNTFVTGSATVGGFIRLLSNSHRAFLLSEAALMLGTAGDANALYQEGIRANMLKTGMTTGEVDAYFLANPTIVTLTGTNAQKRRQIIIQKYISFVPNPIEAYNDFRRTGVPTLSVAQNASGDDPSTIPKRYTYPPNEVARNPNSPKPRPLTNVKLWWAL